MKWLLNHYLLQVVFFFFVFFCGFKTCLKYCSQDEKEVVFKELHPHFLSLASNTYAVHVLQKMLDGGEN